MATINVKDAAGATVAVEKPLAPGAALAASSRPVTLATDDVLVAAVGAAADAASATGSVHAKLRAIATAFGVTALDFGVGSGGSRTLRVAVDSSQTEGNEYEDVAASATAQVLGTTGAVGDFLSTLLVIPETTSPGPVTLLDNAGSRVVFTGGAGSVSNLVPFTVSIGAASLSGAWKVTTGAGVHVMAFGNFT